LAISNANWRQPNNNSLSLEKYNIDNDESCDHKPEAPGQHIANCRTALSASRLFCCLDDLAFYLVLPFISSRFVPQRCIIASAQQRLMFARASGWPSVFRPLSAASVAQAVNRTLERVGLGDVSGAIVKSLPFGQRHFVEIARAIVSEPNLLLLDEPATGLTERERERLATLVKDIAAQGCAQMLIEHDLELIGRLCNRVTVINQGHHIFTGTPAAAQREPEVVRAYLGMNQLISGGGDDARG
jgi:ABC-type dipeptide/oligopeptide/nickel transport system ATPase component